MTPRPTTQTLPTVVDDHYSTQGMGLAGLIDHYLLMHGWKRTADGRYRQDATPDLLWSVKDAAELQMQADRR